MSHSRHDFNKDTKERLAKRVCYRCSKCNRATAGPSADPEGRVMIGVAAHICAASPNGPRYDASQSELQRRSMANAIWLCSACAKIIDDDVERFTPAELLRLKALAEERASHELELPVVTDTSIPSWQQLQTSKIASCSIPFRLPEDGHSGSASDASIGAYFEAIYSLILWAFGHACMSTPYDDFVYIVEFRHDPRSCEPGFVPYLFAIHCHITPFVWAFERLAEHSIDEKPAPTSLLSLPGEQTVEMLTYPGEFVPTRISRSGASSILVQQVSDSRIGLDGPISTSTLLRVIAAAVNRKVLLWDDADLCPDFEKVATAFAKINDCDGFSWSDFDIKRSDPEQWSYVGPR